MAKHEIGMSDEMMRTRECIACAGPTGGRLMTWSPDDRWYATLGIPLDRKVELTCPVCIACAGQADHNGGLAETLHTTIVGAAREAREDFLTNFHDWRVDVC